MIFRQAFGLVSSFKNYKKREEVINVSEAIHAIKLCMTWYQSGFDRQRLPASSYSILLDSYKGPSVRVVAHWLRFFCKIDKSLVLDRCEYANHLVDWLLKIQKPDGSWPVGSSDYNNRPAGIFPGGIAVNALLIYLSEFGKNEEVELAIKKHLEWLIKMQGTNGGWEFYHFNRPLKLSIVAACLFQSGSYFNNKLYSEHGEKAISYILSFQTANGYFHFPGLNPKGHFSSDYMYILFGISETLQLIDDVMLKKALTTGVQPLVNSLNRNQALPGIINQQFKAASNYNSLFASSILALTLLTYIDKHKDENFFSYSIKLLTFLAANQSRDPGKAVNGGFSASIPASGGHKPYEITGESVAIFAEGLAIYFKYQQQNNTQLTPTNKVTVP